MTTTFTFHDRWTGEFTTITATEGMRCVLDGREQVYLRDRFWDVKDIDTGRVRVGSSSDWFARITWAPDVWFLLRTPRFQRMVWR